MKCVFFSIVFLFLNFFIFSQEKQNLEYKIQNIPSGKNSDYYTRSIDKADFSCYRFKTKSRIIRFEDGAELVLFSESQLISLGLKTENCALNDDAKVQDCILKISNEGHLLMELAAPHSKSTSK